METNKIEQIKDKICDHMMSMDLTKLPTYELITYIQAYKALEGGYPFPGWAFGNSRLGCAISSTSATSDESGTSEGE